MRRKGDDGVAPLYSFAMEYKGPPLSYELPRAIPINVSKIPVAAAATLSYQLRDGISLPIVKPLFSQPVQLKPSGTVTSSSELVEPDIATVTTVSPTSVIERATSEDNGMSGELSSSDLLADSSSRARSSETLDPGSSLVTRESHELSRDDWGSSGSVTSLDYCPSSRVSSLKEISHREEFLGLDEKKGPVVTFRGVGTDDDSFLGSDADGLGDRETASGQEIRIAQNVRPAKKWNCYRCGKGNRFSEREVCLVCDAKYCSNCVLRAMGSMPEGRKCVTCIGYPIHESKRGTLGKSSRILKKLLNELEVRQIMKAEKHCDANQLRPDYVFVNGVPLTHEELAILQTCANPPKKLKPGKYWYDKVSGLWGKEGQKPSQIVSHHLNVGAPIRADASNGNTKVFINGREITKVELRMLQLAGVQCAGYPHFWVNEDGSYLEEGQKNPKGYIWGKTGMKLVCALLSLPVPLKSPSVGGGQLSNKNLPYLAQRSLLKLLLVGFRGSGTSTVFKQAKILYKPAPFTLEEREDIKLTIQSNVYGYLGILLEGRDRFEDESCVGISSGSQNGIESPGCNDSDNHKSIYSIGPRLKSFSDWLLKTMVSGSLEAVFPAATREYAPLVEELWKDAAIQATYNRRSELEMLPSVASYFLERVTEILKVDYEPSDMDILYAEGVTSSNGLACVDFSFPPAASDDKYDSDDQHETLIRYQLIRVHAKFGENCKWLEMFEDAGMVIFCVSLIDYDQYSVDTNGTRTNMMHLSRRYFESVVSHPTFEHLDCLLLLTKFDVFEEKIERVPLTQCDWFDDFRPILSLNRPSSTSNSNNSTLGKLGLHYVAVKFKRLYTSLTGRKLYVSFVKGLEPRSVDAALKYAREILKWEDERRNYASEYMFYSTEGGSFSP